MDIFDQKTRSRLMGRIRSKNTKPEMMVRRFLHAKGLRYKLHVATLPGKPDLAFPSRKIAVFVNGCFWHGHDGCPKAALPKTSIDFWKEKIMKNRIRDASNYEKISDLGWLAVVIWECELDKLRLEEIYQYIEAISEQ